MSEIANREAAGIEGSAIPGGHSPNQTGEGERSRRSRRLLAVGGLIGGLMAFLIGEATYGLIPAEIVRVPTPGAVVMAPTAQTRAAADLRNAALAFAGLGGCLGLCLGVAGGLARRSGVAAAVAGLLGLLLGTAVGGGITLATLRWFLGAQSLYPDYDMLLTIGMHGLTWGLPAAAAGLAFAVGLGPGDRRMLVLAPVAGLVGVVVGALAFDVIGAILLPMGSTGEAISATWPSRLVARLVVALGAAGGLMLSIPAADYTRTGGHVLPDPAPGVKSA